MENSIQNDPKNISSEDINPENINIEDINPETSKKCIFKKAIPSITKRQKCKLAKIGLITSMGLLTITGFTKALPFSKKIHTLSGIALLGFSLWHANLYKRTPSKKHSKTESK